MKEQIYTIPVSEAFEARSGKCPLCLLREKWEQNELDLILGASMMEPDIRIQTNEKGFCNDHLHKMYARQPPAAGAHARKPSRRGGKGAENRRLFLPRYRRQKA